MPEKPKRKSASIRALEEMHELARVNCMKVHKRINKWGSVDPKVDRTEEMCALYRAKRDVIKKISTEVEQYVVEKYKKHGIIVVPLCHRSSSNGDDRLEIDLKVKEFPECKKEIEAHRKSVEAYEADMKKIDDWHFQALQAVARKEDLPEIPQLSK